MNYSHLTPRGRAVLCLLGSKLCPNECYIARLNRTVAEEYHLPPRDSAEFIALSLMVEFDSTVMVPYEAWQKLNESLKASGLHRIVPKYQDYYYWNNDDVPNPKLPWDRHNDLINELRTHMEAQGIARFDAEKFLKEVECLRQQFRDRAIAEFNYRNQLVFSCSPFVIGLMLRVRHPELYWSINDDISDLLKRRNLSSLRTKLQASLAFWCVFACRFYDLETALAPDAGRPGRQYEPPKEAISDYILPVDKLTKELSIGNPRFWVVRLLNSFVNTSVYSEMWFKDEPLVTAKRTLSETWAKEKGYLIHGEVALRDDIRRLKKMKAR